MKLPASSNSSTGGAAMPFWSLRTVLGRWRIQAWPWLSIETLETWPHTHLLGSAGHDGSTSKCGIMRGGVGACAEAAVRWPESAMAAASAMTAERLFASIGVSSILLCGSAPMLPQMNRQARGGLRPQGYPVGQLGQWAGGRPLSRHRRSPRAGSASKNVRLRRHYNCKCCLNYTFID